MMTAVACLAMAIYFEARGEPTLGQVAVGHVVMNRVHSERYPSDVCEVVKQAQTRNKKIIKHRCQFSFYCDGKPESAEDESAYLKSIGIAYTSCWRVTLASGKTQTATKTRLMVRLSTTRMR